jgi:hypothetical protein
LLRQPQAKRTSLRQDASIDKHEGKEGRDAKDEAA